MDKTIFLSDEDVRSLGCLAEMIDAGAKEFTKKIKLDNLSLKQELLYFNFIAVNNYSEAVYVLCKDMRPYPAIVVLRSIVEAFINVAYILTHNSDKRALLFSMEDSYYRKGLTTEISVFLTKHPEYEKDRFNREMFKGALEIIEKELEVYNKNLKLKLKNKDDFKKHYHVDLIERAKAVDRKLKKPNFEYIYILVYRYFSEFGHLSMRGLDHFIIKKADGNHEATASQHTEVRHIIATTYTMYLYFLSALKKRHLLDKNFPLSKFTKYWKNEFNKTAPVEL